MAGWDINKLDNAEYNRNAQLSNFPPDKRWQKVDGVLFQQRTNLQDAALLSISGRDHTGAEVRFWTDLPNAMYLLNFLTQIQKQSSANVPSNPPDACKPYDGNV